MSHSQDGYRNTTYFLDLVNGKFVFRDLAHFLFRNRDNGGSQSVGSQDYSAFVWEGENDPSATD